MRGIIHCLKHEIIKLGTNGNMRKHKHVKRMYTVALILLLCIAVKDKNVRHAIITNVKCEEPQTSSP